tara:strand:+ start:1096 stop:2715 length:1620 start_codon:yes stop_codon:yes gene_type:complete
MGQDMRVALKKRAAQQRREENKKLVAARVAALDEKQKAKRDAGLAKQREIRAARLAKEEADRKQLQVKRKAAAISAAELEKKRMLEQQAELAAYLKSETSKLKSPAPSQKKQKTETAAAATPKAEVVPTLQELRLLQPPSKAMPLPSTLACTLQTSIVFADREGLSVWGEDAGMWSHPSGWLSTIETLNQIYKTPGSEPEWCEEVLNGEYNVVFVGRACAKNAPYFPQLKNRKGEVVPLDQVVFRLTRPDADNFESGKGKFYRYKRLANLQREIYFTLHGAVYGFAPECYAALLFPAVVVQTKNGPVQLYGTLYAMHRAQVDLGNLLDQQVEATTERMNPQSMQYVESLRRSGRRVAIKMFPVIYLQSRLGVLSFDAKPGNYVFADDNKPRAIDFDSAMYTLHTSPQWEPNLLMNLTLLTAHVRCYRHPALADGWANALRSLMIELCTHSRGERWLQDARIDSKRMFQEMIIKDTDTQKKCLEMVATAYFVSPRGKVVTPFKGVEHAGASPLMHQLVRFCLHGSISRKDAPLDRALGPV